MTSNPYQAFFEKLDATVQALGPDRLTTYADLEAIDPTVVDDAVDLLRRMGFVLANHINNQAHYLRMLILDPEPAGTVDHAADTSPTDSEEG